MEQIDKAIEVSKLLSEVLLMIRQNMMKGLESSRLTPLQGMLTGILSKNGKMKISELSIKLGLSNSTVSGIIDRLEKIKVVERIRSEEDRRIVFVQVTEKFEECHKDFHKKAEENLKNPMDKATPEELNKVLEGLNILKKLLNNSQHIEK